MDTVAPIASSPSLWRRFWIACLVIAAALTAYFGVPVFVGYTDDAYIRSDLIRIAPDVSGPVLTLHVRDNDHVEAGDLLLTIDPKPFALVVAAKQTLIANAGAALAVKKQVLASRAAEIESATAALDLSQSDFTRISELAGRGFASAETLDKASDGLKGAQGTLALAKARQLVAKRESEAAARDVQSTEADLAIARYDLDRTALTAPTAGYVNNLDVRVGRYATAGEPLVGLVDDTQWRVIANFKEDVAAAVRPGTAVWVWLDTKPWRLYPGHVGSVARAIARSDVPGQLLPYVAPTTDWVRLRRRFPVTIALDPPLPRDALYMGADARVLFWRGL